MKKIQTQQSRKPETELRPTTKTEPHRSPDRADAVLQSVMLP